MDFLTVLPNLSIGVVSVCALAYVTLKHSDSTAKQREDFLKALDERTKRHEGAMFEREKAMRELESSVRQTMSTQLTENTIALADVAKLLGRVVRHLDGDN